MSPRATLFLVDDHEGNRETLEALLTDEGFRVDTAGDYEAAERCVEHAPPYDLVLLDLYLGRRNALSLVGPIRARWPRTKLVIITGAPEAVSPELADAVLRKSDRFEVLLERIAALACGEPPASARSAIAEATGL